MPLSRPRRAALAAAIVLAIGAASCAKDEARLEPAGPNEVEGVEPNQSIERSGSLEDVAVRLEPVASVAYPVALTARPGSEDLYVAQQTGTVLRLTPDESGTLQVDPEPVLDLSALTQAGGERGLLGIAFSADGAVLYAYYTALGGALTVVEHAMAGDVADPSTARTLLAIPHPLPNHNGGQLQLGPDGYLYLGPGDGGGGGDPDRNGQNPDTLLGTLLRIDPTAPADGKPYGIPEGNPFPDGPAPEVWAFGLRNPWRFSFDAETGDLWIGDVGQNLIEEVDFAPATPEGAGRGLNFGWNLMEGTSPFEDGVAPADHTPPIFDYGRDGGNCTVIGGYVYRGREIPDLVGTYVYGDFCRSELRGLQQADGAVTDERSLGVSVDEGTLSSFGEGPDDELYVLSLAEEGTIYRVRPA